MSSVPSFFLVLLVSMIVVSSAVSPVGAWELTDSHWYGPVTKGAVSGGGASSWSGTSSFAGTQEVFFDFDSATTPATEHTYTLAERDAIVAGIAAIYAPWDFTFSHSVVPAGAHAVITFNAGPPGGLASDIDFRNLDLGGTATVDINPLLGFPAPAPAVVGLSTTIGAHELGHLVGLRHADSLGPIGFGLAPTGPPAAAYLPAYPGPLAAIETTGHTMASPASVGQTLAEGIAGSVMGARSAIKLEFNEVGTVTPETAVPHGTPAFAQPLALPTFPVPNTALPGDLYFGSALFADAEVITGTIADDGIPLSGEDDFYSFSGLAGEVLNAEVLSLVPDRLASGDPIDPEIEMLMPDMLTPVPHGTGVAFNDDEFESFDSALIDIVLPVDGTYYIRVSSSSAFAPDDIGDYELFVHRFRAEPIPEPSAICLLALASICVVARGRRETIVN